MNICTCIQVYICIYTYIYIYGCMYYIYVHTALGCPHTITCTQYRESKEVDIYVHIYVHIPIYVHICVYMYIYVLNVYIYCLEASVCHYGVATMSTHLKIIGLFCKRAL